MKKRLERGCSFLMALVMMFGVVFAADSMTLTAHAEEEAAAEEAVSETVFHSDELVELSGRLPLFAIVDVQPVQVTIDGRESLAAYNITIYENEYMQALGIEWQPTESSIRVTIKNEELTDGKNLLVYHMKDENAEPEFVTEVQPEDHTVSFDAASFSIYPIIEGEETENGRLGYRFWYNDGAQDVLLSTQYFRYKDIHPAGDAEALSVSEPGIPEMDSATWNRIFRGWSKTSCQDTDENLVSIETLNEELAAMEQEAFTEGSYIDLYANLKNVFYVTYVDINPNNVLATEIVPKNEDGETTFTVKAEDTLRPTIDSDTVLNGWYDMQNNGETLTPGQEGIVLNSDLTLYPRIEGGCWLIFDDNDLVEDENGGFRSGGASFTAPAFYLNAETEEPQTSPVWTGYSFGGWYQDAACTIEFIFGGMLEHDTTVYAKWIPSESSYRVIVWKQRTSDKPGIENAQKTYDYIYSDLYEDVVTGDIVTLQDAYTNLYGKNGTSEETDQNYFVFNEENTDKAVSVKADGTSVLNVYYDRLPVTLNYHIFDYVYTATTSTSGTQYGLCEGEYVQIYRSGSTWYRTRTSGWGWSYNYSDPYTGTRYTRSTGWQLYRTFTGLYGSTLEENGFSWPAEYDWYSTGSSNGSTSGTRTTFMSSFLPTDNDTIVDFYGKDPSGNKYVVFYVQEEDGSYSERDRVATSGGSFNISDKYVGYHASSYRVDNGTWKNVSEKDNDGYYNRSVSYSNMLEIRFDRTVYDLTFYTNNGTNQLTTVRIAYGTSLEAYASQNPGQRTGYYFIGWFSDPSCTEPFDFAQTMPDTNMAVYGSWKMRRVRVVIEAGSSNVYMGSQADRFRIDYDERIDGGLLASAQRAGYLLDGWYTDAAFTHRFLFTSPVNDSTQDIAWDYQDAARWAAARASYGDDSAEYENVRGILHLYAKWILDTDSIGINVVYDAADAAIADAFGNLLTTVPVDTHMYGFDGTATLREAPSNYSDLYSFKYWEGTKADGTVFHAYPGEPVLLSDLAANDTVLDDDGAVLRFTVIFRAVYEQTGDASRFTTITYDGNTFTDVRFDGSEKVLQGLAKDGTNRKTITLDKEVNQDIVLPTAEAFFLEGFELAGWSFTEGSYEEQIAAETADAPNFLPGQKVAADNQSLNEKNTEANTLYAMWKPKTYGVTLKQVVENGVPAQTHTYSIMTGIEGAVQTKSLTGNNAFRVSGLGHYERIGETVSAEFPKIAENAAYSLRVSAVVTKDDGTTEILEAAEDGSYRVTGNIVITCTYSLKAVVRLQKRDAVDHSKVLYGAAFTLTPVEFNASSNRWENAGAAVALTISEETCELYVQEGTYRISETAAPEGYETLGTDLYLTVRKDGAFDLFTASGTAVSARIADLDESGKILTIYDRPLVPAPTGVKTDSRPYMWVMLFGGLLAAASFFLKKSRKEA